MIANKYVRSTKDMNLMTMEHLTKYYTERMLFEDAAFSINSV